MENIIINKETLFNEFQMEETFKYGVYAKINNENFVTKVYSTCFEEKSEEDILIKEGTGDEFVHVGYYQIIDENNLFNYMFDGENVVSVTDEQKEQMLAEIKEKYNLEHLNDEKNKKIQLSKDELEKWLIENPLEIQIKGVEGEKYSVTKEKQDELVKMIATIDIAKQIGLNFTPTWNRTGQLCEEYTIEELNRLSMEIMTYVYPKIEMQRSFEIEIVNAKTIDDLNKIIIDYK